MFKKTYQNKKHRIIHKAVEDDFIPEGYDLIILKDVIQHWTDESIINYLPKILDKTNMFYYQWYRFIHINKIL